MGRKKIEMELIREDKARMLAFQKRKATLLKKASEFSVLCGVDTCVIIFGPKQNDQPVTWPSNPEEVMRIINKYNSRDKPGISFQISNYFADKKKKVDLDLAKLRGPIFKAKHPAWDDRLNSFSVDQLSFLRGQLEAKLRIVGEKIAMLKVNHYLMDKGTGMQAEASSQLSSSQNFPYDMENYTRRSQFDIDSSRYSAKDLGFFSDLNPFNVQMRSPFQPEQSSHQITTTLAPFLLERNNNNIVYSTDLRLFPDTRPLDVLPPVHYQTEQSAHESSLLPNLMEDASSMNLFCSQNHGYQFGCATSESKYSQYTSYNRLSNANPTPWMWDNALLGNADQPSASYVAPSMWPMPPCKHFPIPSFPQQMRFSEGNDHQFNGGFPHQIRFSEAKENDDAEFRRTDQY